MIEHSKMYLELSKPQASATSNKINFLWIRPNFTIIY